jgi:hypothetical protein
MWKAPRVRHTAHRPPPTAHRPPPTAHRPPPTAHRLGHVVHVTHHRRKVATARAVRFRNKVAADTWWRADTLAPFKDPAPRRARSSSRGTPAARVGVDPGGTPSLSHATATAVAVAVAVPEGFVPIGPSSLHEGTVVVPKPPAPRYGPLSMYGPPPESPPPAYAGECPRSAPAQPHGAPQSSREGWESVASPLAVSTAGTSQWAWVWGSGSGGPHALGNGSDLIGSAC